MILRWWKEDAEGMEECTSEIEALQSICQWQPIETAPRHTTVLLLYMPDGKTHLEPRYGVGGLFDWKDGQIFYDWGWALLPTHWMPLPALPVEKE